jgi:hypothetical protein
MDAELLQVNIPDKPGQICGAAGYKNEQKHDQRNFFYSHNYSLFL